MSNQKVSVIIPSFNRLKYLLNAIESVKNQTYKNIEIIVVNDGSTDKNYLNHKYIKYVNQINLPQNQKITHGFGPGNIRNFGIKLAKGNWIAFLDDDDYWLKSKIELQIQLLNEKNILMSSTDALIGNGIYNPENKYVSYLNSFYYEKHKKLHYRNYFINKLKKLKYPEYFTKEFINNFNPIITSSVVIDKNLLDRLKGFRNLPYAADYDLWKAALQFTKCKFINTPLIYYDNSHGDGREYKK